MNNVIDHAIQVPASTSFIWSQISQLDANPRWQVDCTHVSFLTSLRSGLGTRWRSQTKSAKDWVIEITAWYEGLGYEYQVVDGAPFGKNRGRLRLQEIAEGTIVQWTFSYELTGLLAGIRNTISIKRQLDSAIVESLRNLYRIAKEQNNKIDPQSVKSLMRDALDYEQRRSYAPRHPSAISADKDAEKAMPLMPNPAPLVPEASSLVVPPPPIPIAPLSANLLQEPPPSDDDTKPNRAIRPETPAPTLEAPEFAKPPTPQPNTPVVMPQADLPTLNPSRPPAIFTPATPTSTAEPSFLSQVPNNPPATASKPLPSITPEPLPAVVVPPAPPMPSAPPIIEPLPLSQALVAQEPSISTPAEMPMVEPMPTTLKPEPELTPTPIPATPVTPVAELPTASVMSTDEVPSIPSSEPAPPMRAEELPKAVISKPEAPIKPYEPPMILGKTTTGEMKRSTGEIPVSTTPSTKLNPAEPISSALETREISVFDLFGVPRPSRTQEMKAASTSASFVPNSRTTLPTGFAPRTGYRIKLRRRSIKLRKPN